MAERLTEAARSMREQHGPEHRRHAMWAAIADWLEEVEWRGRHYPKQYRGIGLATRVADEYLKAVEGSDQ